MPVPKQRNIGVENQAIKQGKRPEGREDKPNNLRQRDLDTRWVKKNGTSHYGYKNSICIDAENEFIRRYAVTPANIHDRQMLTHVLDPENIIDFIWADSGYAGVKFEEMLELAGYESCIHEKGTRNHPLSHETKERNQLRAKVRARVEHVFGGMTTCVRGKLSRLIGLARNKAWWALRNLTYNFLRYLDCTRAAAAAA